MTPSPEAKALGQQAAAGTYAAAANAPLQQQGYNIMQGAQGLAQPYFTQGAGYLGQSAIPITASDVANYYNPMAGNVFAGLQDIYGTQMRDITGQLTKAAGGVGADRIAVGQAELARQQDLAAGQTAAGLYQQALQAAQMQKQMQAGAGYGIAQMGMPAQQAAISGVSAMQAYPFMVPQAEAGIASQLMAPLGYGQSGTSTTTQPSPSPLSQALGVGTSLFGLGMKGMGAGGGLGTGGMGYNPYGPSGIYNKGGKVMADGGRTGAPLYGEILPPMSHTYPRMPFPLGRISEGGAVMPFHAGQGFADGGMPMGPIPAVAQLPQSYMDQPLPQSWQNFSNWLSANPLPASNWMQTAANTIPAIPMALPTTVAPMGLPTPVATDRSPKDVSEQQPDQSYLQGGYSSGGIAHHYQDGGGEDSYNPIEPDFEALESPLPSVSGIRASPSFNLGIPIVSPPSGETPTNALAGSLSALQQPAITVSGTYDRSAEPTDTQTISARQSIPSARGQSPLPTQISPDDIGRYDLPPSRTPYPDALQRDWGQRATRSPWMALVRAGAKMAQTRGPIGSVIGAGLGEYAGALEGERGQLRGEEAINQKAQQLFQQAREHLDLYSKGNFHVVGIGADGQPILMEQKTGQMTQSPTAFTPLHGVPTLQSNAAWLKAIGAAPDLKTASEMLHTGVNAPFVYNRAVEGAKRTLLNMGFAGDQYALEAEAKRLVEQRGIRPPPLVAPSPTTQGPPSRPASVPPDAGYSPSTGRWYSRVQNKSWDTSGAEVP